MYYAKVSGRLHREKFVDFLDVLHVRMLKFEYAPEYVRKRIFFEQTELSVMIYEQLFSEFSNSKLLKDLYLGCDRIEERFGIVIQELIDPMIHDLAYVILWAKGIADESSKKIYIITGNIFAGIIRNHPNYEFKFLYPSILYFNLIALLFLKVIRNVACAPLKLGKRLSWKIRQEPAVDKRPKTGSSKSYEILYFPHKGVEYAKLFIKNQFYHPNPNSPFNEKNILHLEVYDRSVIESGMKKTIKEYYEKNDIPFAFFGKPKFIDRVSILRRFSFVVLRNFHKLWCDLKRDKVLCLYLMGKMFHRVSNYMYCLNKYQTAKIALIGYDWLFPGTLSIALNSLNITTIAIQERYANQLYPQFRLISDHYLISSDYFKDLTNNNSNLSISHVKAVGDYRLDTLFHYKRNATDGRLSAIKSKYYLILALDFHSVTSKIESHASPFLNWESNKQFYQDLIQIAIEIPESYIIIRGKNDDWCQIDEFAAIVESIQKLPNMEIDRNYTEYNVSYKIAAHVDCIVARYTTLVDEALAANIPSLIVDYFPPSHKKIFHDFFKYDDYPIFVYSYEELESRLKQLVYRNHFFPEDRFQKMRQMLYGDSFDGKVRERIQDYLSQVYVDLNHDVQAS